MAAANDTNKLINRFIANPKQLQDRSVKLVTDAAMQCLNTAGADKTSIDDIVALSGVSRTTLYRRFGSKEGIFAALLLNEVWPLVRESEQLMANETKFSTRIEIGFVHAVNKMPTLPTVRALLNSGASNSSIGLFRPIFSALVSAVLQPTLEIAEAAGQLRKGIEFNEILEWLLREFMMLVADAPWGEAKLRRHIRFFILPILVENNPDTKAIEKSASKSELTVKEHLGVIDQRLTEMNLVMSMMRQQLSQK